MRFPHRKSQPERFFDDLTDSLGGLSGVTKRSNLVKVSLVAGGLAALAAGSAAVSSLRRRMGESDS
jgi:hypothetical protein